MKLGKLNLISLFLLVFLLSSCTASDTDVSINKEVKEVIYETSSNTSNKGNIFNNKTKKDFLEETLYYNVIIHLDYDVVVESKDSILRDSKSVDERLVLDRNNSKEKHSNKNNLFVKKMKQSKDIDKIIPSNYAPFITVTFKSNNIKIIDKYAQDILKLDNVKDVYIKEIFDYGVTDKIYFAGDALASNINTSYTDSNYPNLTGNGVKIGVLDGGIVDVNNNAFNGLTTAPTTVLFPGENIAISPHATAVADIIGGYHGLAPDSELYSVGWTRDDGFTTEIEWLLDQGVHIINMSIGDLPICNSSGYSNYAIFNIYLDYIVRTQSVTMVAATGNELEFVTGGYVCSPASADNVISVGAVLNDGTIAAFSNYYTRTGTQIGNPVIVAPSELTIVDGLHTIIGRGTSFSTPLVTGAIALMMEDDPSLKYSPAKVISKLIATSSPESVIPSDQVYIVDDIHFGRDYYDEILPDVLNRLIPFREESHPDTLNQNNNLRSRSGSGMIDLKEIFKPKYEYNYSTISYLNGPNTKINEKVFYVGPGDRVSIGIANLRNGTATGSFMDTTYLIKLYNSMGYLVDATYHSSSNIGAIRYTAYPFDSGSFKLEVWRYDSIQSNPGDMISYTIIVE